MTYKWIKENVTVQRLADGACIPHDPANMDWLEFQSWVAAGNTPEPVDQPDPRQVIKAQLAAIDQATGSVRWIRELALGNKEAWDVIRANGIPLPPEGSGMAKVQAIEEQCKALRAQLAALP